MKLGPIGGYIVTIGGYGAPLKEHRENTVLVYRCPDGFLNTKFNIHVVDAQNSL